MIFRVFIWSGTLQNSLPSWIKNFLSLKFGFCLFVVDLMLFLLYWLIRIATKMIPYICYKVRLLYFLLSNIWIKWRNHRLNLNSTLSIILIIISVIIHEMTFITVSYLTKKVFILCIKSIVINLFWFIIKALSIGKCVILIFYSRSSILILILSGMWNIRSFRCIHIWIR